MAAPLAGIIAGIGRAAVAGGARAAATGGGRAIASGAVEGAKGAVKGLINRKQNNVQSETPFSGNVVEGMATAVKGSGGGGGALVPTGGGALVSRKSSAIVKSGGTDILSKFDVLINAFRRLIEIEQENKKRLEDQILSFARSSEKDGRSAEQSGQEKSKGKSKKNPIIEGGKKAFKGIFGFIGDLVAAFIKYKILDWISKPENTKAIQNTIQFFMNVGKLLGFIGKFVVGPIFNIIKELQVGQFKIFGEVIEAIVNIFSLKWLTNPLEFIKDLLDIPKAITEMAINVIKSVIDFMTFGLVSGAADLIGNAIKGFFGMGEEKKEETVEQASSESPQPQKQENPLQKTGNFIKGAAGAVLNPIGAIGNMFSGMFGGGDKGNDGTPQLREGGVVSKNGVKVEPLDALSKISGVGGYIGKTIKMFMSLLTMPFRLVGAALIALVMNTVGKIPGVGPFIKPILQNIISKFDLPSSLASMVLGKSPEQMKEKKKSKELKPSTTKTGSNTPPPTADPENSIDPSSPSAVEAGKQGAGSIDQTRAGATSAMKAGQSSQTGGNFSSKAEDAERRNLNFEARNRKYIALLNTTNGDYEVFEQGMFGHKGQRIDIKDDKNIDIKQKAFNQVRAYYINNNKSKGIELEYITEDDVKNKLAADKKAAGGWITGPQSGYPVSLDGGMSTSFIGHGTEWVGFKKAGGGTVSSAFVIPFDTPATRSNGGLVGRRMNEAKTGGYALPYASGGPVKNTAAEPAVTKGSGKGASTGGLPAVINTGKQLISKGFTVKEHPNFAGRSFDPSGNQRVGGHSGGSLHYKKLALDVTDWRSGDWMGRTKHLAEALYQKRKELKLTQIIHDPWGSWFAGESQKGGSIGGHPTHLHLGFASGPGAGDIGDPASGGGGSDAPSGGGPDTSSPETSADAGFMGSGASVDQLKYLMANLGMSSSGQELTDVQSQNIVSQSFAGAGKPGGIKVIAGENKDVSSAMDAIQSPSLGNTLPKDGKWSTYSFNL